MAIQHIKKQGKHYWLVFRWMMSSYYRQEKKSFWLIQLLMGISMVLGLVWLLGLIAGLNFLNDPGYLDQYQVSFLKLFFQLPIGIWVVLLSIAGLLGAAISFLSFHVGVRSVIRYQVKTIKDIFGIIQDDNNHQWVRVVENEPLSKTNQIIKLSVGMTGLVVRRLSRMLIPLITFLVSLVVLIKLDGYLLSLLAPLAILYVFALYFINRYAARNQVILSGLSKKTMRSLGDVIKGVLNRTVTDQETTAEKIMDSGYHTFSDYRYKRRLAEIHVTWLNTLFLVLGCAVIILSVDFTDKTSFDWMHLLYFIVALRYAGSGLQQMASATVSFSRFLPEVELVYALLHDHLSQSVDNKNKAESYSGNVFILGDHFGESLIAEALIKHNYTRTKTQPLNEFIQSGGAIEHECWIYTDKPAQFKQAVRKYAAQIDWVLIESNAKVMAFDNVQNFLGEFDPKGFIKNSAQSAMIDDEEL